MIITPWPVARQRAISRCHFSLNVLILFNCGHWNWLCLCIIALITSTICCVDARNRHRQRLSLLFELRWVLVLRSKRNGHWSRATSLFTLLDGGNWRFGEYFSDRLLHLTQINTRTNALTNDLVNHTHNVWKSPNNESFCNFLRLFLL